MYRRLFYIVCAAVLATGLMTACSDSSCYDGSNSLPLVRFYMSGGDGKPVTVNGVTLRGVGAPKDSAYVSGKAVSEAYLPLRATMTSTQWVMEITTTAGVAVNDTLSMEYSSEPYFASAECGATFAFDIKRVACTHNLVDSVVLVHQRVTNEASETVRVYFKNNK